MKRKDSKLYEKKITLGRDSEGALIRKSIYAKTKAELEKKVFEAKQSFLTESSCFTNDMIFSSFARSWLKTEKAGKGIRTIGMYRSIIETYLCPEIGDLYLSEITQDDLIRILQHHFTKHETCNKIKLTLCQLYEHAERSLLVVNPHARPERLTLPPKKKVSKRAISEKEKNALFSAELTDKERAFVLTLFYTGMRKEEALALTAADFDLKSKKVHVDKVRVWSQYENQVFLVPGAKNNYSVRDIPLPDEFIKQVGPYISSCDGFLFGMLRKDNSLMTEHSFRWMWHHIQKALGKVEPSAASLTPHLFRHNYATLLYYSNISPKMAARLLGHADTTMIMRVYAHLDEEKENTAEKLNAVFMS